jgi:hypothetical protein
MEHTTDKEVWFVTGADSIGPAAYREKYGRYSAPTS